MAFNVFMGQTPSSGSPEGIYLPSTASRSRILVNGNFNLAIGGVEVVQVADGSSHSLFRLADGSVYTCGWSLYGQLGTGSTTQQNTPVRIASLSNVADIAAGSIHSLFCLANGDVYACGNNANGQLGQGGTSASIITPVQVTVGGGGGDSIYPDRALLVKTKHSVASDYFTIFDNGLDASSNPLNKVRVAVDKVYWTNPETKLDEEQTFIVQHA